jgi:hypothetical protein
MKNGHQGEGGGRPSKKTPEAIKKLEEAASLDCSIPEMCFHAEISKQTYYTWIEDDPKLLDRLESLRQKPFMNCRAAIQKAVAQGNAEMALKYLERKRKIEFAPKSEVEHSGTLSLEQLIDGSFVDPKKDKGE